VGGELTYVCLGNNDYRITLKVYRDCFNGQAPFDNPAPVGIFDGNGVLFTVIDLNFPGSTNVPPISISPCLVPPGNVCVEEAVYQGVVNLPPSATGYTLVYQRCCRNGTISNLINPNDVGSTYTASIPGTSVALCNSNPVFNNFPPIFLCANVPINFDHSATDSDGDSLVYFICEPLDGGSSFNPTPNPPDPPPYISVPFASPYSASNPMGGNPPLFINQSTGLLTGTPVTIGQFVVGVCVSEYRNGVLLSTSRRDFQFNIVPCQAAIASIPSQTTFCDGFTVDFNGTSINGNSYFWNFGDPTTLADTSNQANTQYTYPDSGTYTVMLVAYDPAGNCYDTAFATFEVYPLLDPFFINPSPQCLNGNSFNFVAGGSFDSSADFLWNFGGAGTSNAQNPTGISFANTGNFPVNLTISQFGCTETYSGSIDIIEQPVASIDSATQYCVGTNVSFYNNSSGSDHWFWDFGVPLIQGDTSQLFEPVYQFPDTGIFTITLIAANVGCSDTTQLDFFVYPRLAPDIIGAGDACLDVNSFDFSAGGTFTTDATFLWNFGSTANSPTSTQQNPQNIVFQQLGYYPISLTISQYGCSRTDDDTVGLFNRPVASFGFEGGTGCTPLKIAFKDSSTSDTPLLYFWNLGDNSSSIEQNPEHVYFQPGVYDVSVTIITETGCRDTVTYLIPGAVKAVQPPIAGLTIDRYKTTIFDPIFNINDTAKFFSFNELDISDGANYNSYPVVHTFADTGYYSIIQTVKNEIGCIDTLELRVLVEPEFRLWIPNSFTPNKDGLNERFLPMVLGITTYDLRIYNRWGQVIFRTQDSDAGWDGTSEGVECPQDGYIYHLELTPYASEKKVYIGSVTLIR
jgi:gliding motility-associated-like protein